MFLKRAMSGSMRMYTGRLFQTTVLKIFIHHTMVALYTTEKNLSEQSDYDNKSYQLFIVFFCFYIYSVQPRAGQYMSTVQSRLRMVEGKARQIQSNLFRYNIWYQEIPFLTPIQQFQSTEVLVV